MEEWVVVSKRYACEIVEVQNAQVPEVTQIIGNHSLGFNNSDVEGFYTYRNDFFTVFPRNLGKFFPNLVAVIIARGNLATVSSDDLAAWSNLTLFSLRENRFETLDGNLFQHSPRLAWISFFNNLINSVEGNLLSNLNDLTYVDFKNNSCINTLAETPAAIEALRNQLYTQCSTVTTTASTTRLTTPILTTTLESCTARCSLNDEVDDLKALTVELKALAEQQAKLIDEQKALAFEQGERIEEQRVLAEQQAQQILDQRTFSEEQAKRVENLEATVRELTTNPCSCN